MTGLALIGGTGGMGAFILDELRQRGHRFTAIVRRPDALTPEDTMNVVLADVHDPQALAAALTGVDIVVSAFNPGWQSPDLYERYLHGARSIQQAANAAGVNRLLVVGGASSLLAPDGRQLIESGLPPEPYGSGVRAARDHLEEIRSEQTLDWVYLSPPADCGPIGPDGRRGTYRTGRDHPVLDDHGRNSLSRQDLAVAVVDEVDHPAHHRERFTVGY